MNKDNTKSWPVNYHEIPTKLWKKLKKQLPKTSHKGGPGRPRVKDIDFEQCQIVVREGRGEKDRLTMLPASLVAPLISLEDNYSLDPGETAFLAFLSGINTAAQEAPVYERLVGEHPVDVHADFAGLAGPDKRLKRIPRQFTGGELRRTPPSRRIQNG